MCEEQECPAHNISPTEHLWDEYVIWNEYEQNMSPSYRSTEFEIWLIGFNFMLNEQILIDFIQV